MAPNGINELLALRPLDFLPLWVFYILTVILLLLSTEGGYYLSKVFQRRFPDKAEASVGALNGATLALLTFLMAFVTSSAVSNFTSRRQAVVTEANAIGTTYLRAGYLPEPYGTESRQLLREYVEQRLATVERERVAGAIARSEEIHSELWAMAEEMAKEDSSPVLALYIGALNAVIDLHTDRINLGLVFRIPEGVTLSLTVMAILSLGMVGLHAGYAGSRNRIAWLAFVLTLALVFLLIVDLGRSEAGMFRVSQQALFDLQRQISLSP